jgi:hypothetical protein
MFTHAIKKISKMSESTIRKRNPAAEKDTPLDDASSTTTTKPSTPPPPLQAPTISRTTLAKFVFFSLLVLVCPLATFFTVRAYLDEGARSTSIAAVSAVIAVNVVALAYIVVAVREGDEEDKTE